MRTERKTGWQGVDITAHMPEDELEALEELLRRDSAVEDAGDCEVLRTLTFDFGGGIEADVKVCNGDTGPWVDSVLFEHGDEVQVLEPSDMLAGEYPFEHPDGRKFNLEIKAG